MNQQKQIAAAMIVHANRLLEKVVEAGEVTQDIDSQISHMEFTGFERIDMTVYLLEKVKSEKVYWKARADFFTKIAKSFDHIEEKIKESVKINMVERGEMELLGVDMRFKLSEIEPRLEMEAEKIHDSYRVLVETKKIDDSKIRADLKAGKKVDGAMLVPNFRLASYANKQNKIAGVS